MYDYSELTGKMECAKNLDELNLAFKELLDATCRAREQGELSWDNRDEFLCNSVLVYSWRYNKITGGEYRRWTVRALEDFGVDLYEEPDDDGEN